MNIHDATEIAYNNGYGEGFKAGRKKGRSEVVSKILNEIEEEYAVFDDFDEISFGTLRKDLSEIIKKCTEEEK